MRAFFDIDTQIDFLYAGGALYGSGGEKLIEPVGKLNRYAVQSGIPLISSICSHPENAVEFREWPPHCVAGTVGQQKPAALLAAKRIHVPSIFTNLDVRGYEQILLEKDDLDLFTNPNLIDILHQLEIDDCVVYGAFTEYCVKCAVSGLLKTGRKVSLVTDAIAALNGAKGEEVMEHFVAAGGKLVKMQDLLQA